MRKWEVKAILNTLRTPYNEKEVNLVLARVDMTPDFRLEKLIAELGNDKNAIIQYFQENVDQMCDRNDDKVQTFDDNKYVKSAIMRDSFLMCVDTRSLTENRNALSEVKDEILVQEAEKYARSTQKDVATLHTFDSMRKLLVRIGMNDSTVSKLKDICVYFDGEIDIPEEFCESSASIDLETLSDSSKLKKDSNLRKAVQLFGTETPLKVITISMETFKSKEFGEMMIEKMKEIEGRGIKIEPTEQEKEDVKEVTPSNNVGEKTPDKEGEDRV